MQTPVEGTTFAALARHWQRAEELGYDAAWLDDHFYGVVTPPSVDSLECWTLMAALARKRRGCASARWCVCNNYRNPALLAKMASTLDHVSAGRLEFGIGAGWYEHEYLAYGYGFPPFGTRLAQLAEALEICMRMWRDERATFAGRYYRVERAWCNPKPRATAASADHDRRRRREGAAAVGRAVRPSAGTLAARVDGSATRSRSSSATAPRPAATRDDREELVRNMIIEPTRRAAALAKRAARGHGDAYGLTR